MITQDRVRELFDYADGELIWRVSVNWSIGVGTTAGSLNKCSGYNQVKIDGKSYQVHRIIWLWHYGYFPEHGLDHINRLKADNRVHNLREVSQSCNIRNSRSRGNNSGVRGVNFHKDKKKYQVYITASRKQIYLGTHFDFTEAVAHRLAAEQCLNWGSCDSSSPAYQYMKEHTDEKIAS